MKQYLFAYGTLADGNPRQEIATAVKQLKSLGKGYIFARLYDLGEYPGALLDDSKRHKVFGKIFQLPNDSQILTRLDEYEAFDPRRPAGSLFVRKRTAINRPNHPPLTGWVYAYNGRVSSQPLIKHGHYAKLSS
jgi:gamma-glutamylcyclotransferase (GGCT)/AIG2-like uncharacterized protein YtfP